MRVCKKMNFLYDSKVDLLLGMYTIVHISYSDGASCVKHVAVRGEIRHHGVGLATRNLQVG
jgi:hypothetical protein